MMDQIEGLQHCNNQLIVADFEVATVILGDVVNADTNELILSCKSNGD